MNEERLNNIRDLVKKKYPILANTPLYEFEEERGFYNSAYENMCSDLTGGYASFKSKHICIRFFTYLESILVKGALGNNKEMWDKFTQWFKKNKTKHTYVSEFMEEITKNFKETIIKNVNDNFKKFTYLTWNDTELENIMKLYYFSKNIADIQTNLNDSIHSDKYKVTCEYVNECLDIYRKYKYTKCNGSHLNLSGGSSICYELEPFARNYNENLVGKLTYNNGSAIPIGNDISKARVHCSLYEKQYGYNPRGLFFKNVKSTLTPTGTLAVGGLSIVAICMVIYILYKYTPMGDFFAPESRSSRRRWRNREIYDEYMREVYQHDDEDVDSSYMTSRTSASNQSAQSGSSRRGKSVYERSDESVYERSNESVNNRNDESVNNRNDESSPNVSTNFDNKQCLETIPSRSAESTSNNSSKSLRSIVGRGGSKRKSDAPSYRSSRSLPDQCSESSLDQSSESLYNKDSELLTSRSGKSVYSKSLGSVTTESEMNLSQSTDSIFITGESDN